MVKHIFVCIFPPKAKFLKKITFFDGNSNIGHKCIAKKFRHTLSTNYIVRRWFLIINNVKPHQTFLLRFIFLERDCGTIKPWN